MRASGKDATVVLSEPIPVTLDYALEYVADDELVEITPESVRMRSELLLLPNSNTQTTMFWVMLVPGFSTWYNEIFAA